MEAVISWYYLYPVLIFAGIFCGFVNTLAGCGGATAFAAINMFVPANVANGTYRIPILIQNITGAREFAKHKAFEKETSLLVVIPMAVGGIFGAIAVVFVSVGNLKLFVGIVMFVFLFLQIKKLITGKKDRSDIKTHSVQRFLKYIVFFCVGFYGGFIQIGVGVFSLIAIEAFTRLDLFKANAVKILGILCYTVPATLIFLCSGLVRWDLGLIMAIGNIAGAKVAVKSASKVDPKYIRYLLILVLLSAGIYYTEIYKIFSGGWHNLH